MFQLNRFDTERFINKAFYYFNGRVNTFNNRCKLVINWLSMPYTQCYGTYMTPDIIIIYPTVIYETMYYDLQLNVWGCIEAYLNEFRCKVVKTLIHELFHADQVLITGLTDTIEGEAPVHKETIEYLIYHKEEIEQALGIDYYPEYDEDWDSFLYDKPMYYWPYVRRSISTHIVHSIADMAFGDPDTIMGFTDLVRRVHTGEDLVLILLMENEDFCLYDKGWCDLYQFNEFITRTYCNWMIKKANVIIIRLHDKPNWYVVRFGNIVRLNLMCTLNGDYNNI